MSSAARVGILDKRDSVSVGCCWKIEYAILRLLRFELESKIQDSLCRSVGVENLG